MNTAAAAVKMPKAIGIVAAIALSLGGATPVAHAAPSDDFLAQVRANGIGVNVPDASVLKDAQEVCDMLDYQEKAYTYLNQHSGLNREQSAVFIRASVKYFCPQYAPQIGGV
jgi:uncharacterized protein (DUF486 family)